MPQRLTAELLGTFAIVFFGCGSIVTLQGGGLTTHFVVNAVFGLTVAASIYALGHISAAHFNPAVTVGFASAKRFPWKCVPAYIGAQVVGALLACGLLAWFVPAGAAAVHFGTTASTLDVARTIGFEAVLTFFLMLVIISVATDKRVNGAIPGLAIGMAVSLCGLFGGPVSGCSMNPARSLAPAIFAGGDALGGVWPYLIGPTIGAVLASLLYEQIRGSAHHGQGAPNDLYEALSRIDRSKD